MAGTVEIQMSIFITQTGRLTYKILIVFADVFSTLAQSRYPMEFAEVQLKKQNFKISNTQRLLSTWTLIHELSILYIVV